MSREIKFRHFDPNYKAMTPFEEIRILPSDKKFCHLFNPDSDGGFLMQFTGLKDKNGVEIYEGDIVVWKVNNMTSTAPVYFDEEQACFWMGKDKDSGHLVLNDWMRGEHEVIGNIHQNSELL